MAINEKFPVLWHGGDYNPEQWPRDVREEDVRLMKLAHTNLMSVGIFSWAELEPEDGQFEFGWLDETLDRLHEAGVCVALTTPSAALPRWLSDKYPEVLAVRHDVGRPHHAGRTNFCPTSPVYREHVGRIDRALAERYGEHPAVVLWHVSNEYNTGGFSRCYCEKCVEAFRDWLRERYGDIETLNRQYWSRFWSQRFFDFDQVHAPPPRMREPLNGLTLDWRRFSSDQLCDFFAAEVEVLRRITPGIPVTTNLMGLYDGVDYKGTADIMDVISWDSYPDVGGDPFRTAFTHAYMRGLKKNRPWLLMEQTPSSTNWKEYHRLKPPGLMRLWSWQAIAHGSDSVMYFQWRRCRGGHEKFHGAVVEHAGNEQPRVFREVAQLGEEMEQASEAVVGTAPTEAKVGILWDTESRWALECSAGPSRHSRDAVGEAIRQYRAIAGQGVAVDVVRPDGDWSQYEVLIAPMMYMVKSGQFGCIDEGAKLADWVASGGTLVATYLTGIVNENDLVYEGGYPGPLREVLGLWAEEIDNHPAGEAPNRMVMAEGAVEGARDSYACDEWFDQIHPEGAEVLATYGQNWYAGRACLTKNAFGDGSAYYLACKAGEDFLSVFYRCLLGKRGIEPVAKADADVEVTRRRGGGRELLFLLNHADVPRMADLGEQSGTDVLTGESLSGDVELPGYGVRVVRLS